jgi:GGDEF domain-containing protein
VARFGGDEFAILITDLGDVVTTRVAERIRQELCTPFTLEGIEIYAR